MASEASQIAARRHTYRPIHIYYTQSVVISCSFMCIVVYNEGCRADPRKVCKGGGTPNTGQREGCPKGHRRRSQPDDGDITRNGLCVGVAWLVVGYGLASEMVLRGL